MTTFIDGPAKGKYLSLKVARTYLRVTESKGVWDALDLPTDEPRPDEKLYLYRLHENLGMCRINRGGGRGGFYPIASYRFVEPQPDDATMRSTIRWQTWLEMQDLKSPIK